MPETFARIASIALALAFAWAGVSKLVSFRRWTGILELYALPRAIKRSAAVTAPFAELAISVAIVVGAARTGAVGALAALGVFSAAIVRARAANGDRLPCGCFGGSSERHYKTMLTRNAALGMLAAIVLGSDRSLGPLWPSAPTTGELLPAILSLAGTVLILWVAWQASISLRGREHH